MFIVSIHMYSQRLRANRLGSVDKFRARSAAGPTLFPAQHILPLPLSWIQDYVCVSTFWTLLSSLVWFVFVSEPQWVVSIKGSTDIIKNICYKLRSLLVNKSNAVQGLKCQRLWGSSWEGNQLTVRRKTMESSCAVHGALVLSKSRKKPTFEITKNLSWVLGEGTTEPHSNHNLWFLISSEIWKHCRS